MKNPKKGLIIVHSKTHSRVLLPYVKRLHELNFPLSFIFTRDECKDLVVDYPKSENLFCLFNHDKYNKKDSKFKFLRVIYLIVWFIKLNNLCKLLMKKYDPDFVILSSDRYFELGLMISKYCKDFDIPSYVLGIDYFYVEQFEGYYTKFRKPLLRSNPVHMLICRLFKDQVFEVKDFFLIFYRPYIILILKSLNLLPRKPFLSGYDFSMYVLVDCEKTRDVYLEHGADINKIKVFGLLDHDTIFNNTISPVRDSSEDLVIVALPQLNEHNLLNKADHFNEIRYLVSEIAQYSTNLLVSLHPKMNINDYLFLENIYKVRISDESLINIIHHAKIFISTYSSTVLWSIALGIPSIIVDFYNLNYSYYKSFKGVNKFTKKDDFEKFLKEILTFSDLYESNKKIQLQDSKDVAKLDGGTMNRFVELINTK